MNRPFKHLLFVAILSLLGMAASAQTGYSDLNLGLSYDPYEITVEWDEWYQEETEENAYIGEFMQEYDVPQSGQNGLSRKEIWYWWISNNPDEVEEYIQRRDEAEE